MYDIIPQRKEFLAGLQGLGGGPQGYQFRRTILPDANYIDDCFLVNTRLKNPEDTSLMQYSYDRIDAGLKFASPGYGKSLMLNFPGRYNNQAFMKTGALTGVSPSKAFTISFWVYPLNTQQAFKVMGFGRTDVNATRFEVMLGHYLAINAWNSENSRFLDVNTSSYQPIPPGEWVHILISMDLSSTSKRKAYWNDTAFTNWTWGQYQNQNILFDSEGIGVFCERMQNGALGGKPPDGYVRDFYFDTNYIDIGQESNRRIFRTADGLPVSQASLEARNPPIYMRFDDQDTFDTNLGTGGAFTAHSYSGSNYHVVNFGPDNAPPEKVKGGMIWTKRRNGTSTYNHLINDTERGQNCLYPNDSGPQVAENVNGTCKFDFSGASLDTLENARNNGPAGEFVDWCFQRQPGFFDMIKYEGNGVSGREIDHNLGCVPGLMIVKQIDGSTDWKVYCSNNLTGKAGPSYGLTLNNTDGSSNDNGYWNGTAPTKTKFIVGNDYKVNQNGQQYIAYLFATSNSQVEWRGTDDYYGVSVSETEVPFSNTYSVHGLLTDTSSNGRANVRFYDQGSDDYTCPGEFTWEMFYKQNGSSYMYLFTIGDSGTVDGGKGLEAYFSGTTLKIYRNGGAIDNGSFTQSDTNWHHLAITRDSGNTLKVYIDGTVVYTISNVTGDVGGGKVNGIRLPITIGGEQFNGMDYGRMDSYYSNCRLTKGQVLYTSNFTSPTSALTTTSQGATASNVKLLALQGPSVSSLTVAAVANGNNDIEYSFGRDEESSRPNQGVVNVGHYQGNSNNEGPVIDLGWQPQYVMIKSLDADNMQHWVIIDKMRGVGTDLDTETLWADNPAVEQTAGTAMFTSTGFRIVSFQDIINKANKWYMFIAIRFPDGKVGRPPESGLDVFGMDTGNGNIAIPAFRSSVAPYYNEWPVDFAFQREPNTTANWLVSGRLTHRMYNEIDSGNGEAQNNNFNFDHISSWGLNSTGGWNQSTQSWMWKRNKGFEMQVFRGKPTGRTHQHNMGIVPQMIWVKKISSSGDWMIYHSGLNGGVNPEQYYIPMKDQSEVDTTAAWNDTAPTASEWTSGTHTDSGGGGSTTRYMAMLFGNVKGISKCGWYTGDGTLDGSHEINLGFTPRLLIIKCIDNGVNFNHWRLWDSLNGLDSSGTESYLKLNNSGAKVSSYDYIDTTATGFKLNTIFGPVNGDGNKMIYYAHA